MDSCLVHYGCGRGRGPRRGDFSTRVWTSLAELGTVLFFMQFCLVLRWLCKCLMFKESLFIFQFKMGIHVYLIV